MMRHGHSGDCACVASSMPTLTLTWTRTLLTLLLRRFRISLAATTLLHLPCGGQVGLLWMNRRIFSDAIGDETGRVGFG
jgi:hypothetical protein